jgi:phage repressor protein C with HTH and peptisase S24 domain
MGGTGLVLHDQPGVIKSWQVSEDWLRRNVRGFLSASDLCIVTGFGDSMKPMFNPGDPLLVDTSIRKVDCDGCYFFRVGNEGFIKRLQRIPGEGIRVLSANNGNYEPWTVTEDMDFQVLGRVLKVWLSDDL